MERRILILSCFTGEGHNSAAKAMHSAFDALEVPSRIMDPVSFQGKHAQHFISSFYNGMIRRSPGAFRRAVQSRRALRRHGLGIAGVSG